MSNQLTLLMVGYKAFSGKDTFYSFAKSLGYTRIAFADKLKEVVGDLYNLNYEQLYGSGKEIIVPKYNLSPRQILQQFGQEQRKRNPDIWANYVFENSIPKLVEKGINKIIITDFRFKNEAEVAKEWKYTNRDLVNLKFINIYRTNLVSYSSDDISENDLNDFKSWDHMIDNNGSIDAYKKKVLEYITQI